jgi:membrane protein involved in colicin uptake
MKSILIGSLSIILTAVICISLAGCSGNDSDKAAKDIAMAKATIEKAAVEKAAAEQAAAEKIAARKTAAEKAAAEKAAAEKAAAEKVAEAEAAEAKAAADKAAQALRLPKYSQVLSTYPAGTDLCSTEADIMGGDDNGVSLGGGSGVSMRNGSFVYKYYGTKLTVKVTVTLGGKTYSPGTKLTVDRNLAWIAVSGWD